MAPRPSTVARGYGAAHRALRARLAPLVERGGAFCCEPVCVKPSRWIRPGSEWHLSHNDTRTGWRGPAHAACNEAAAARKRTETARRASGAGPARFRTSQEW